MRFFNIQLTISEDVETDEERYPSDKSFLSRDHVHHVRRNEL